MSLILGTALAAAGSVAGAIGSARANRMAQDRLNRAARENEDWYNREYNTDATQRADAQNAIRMVSEALRRNGRMADGSAAVSGATQESVAQQKAAATNALASVASNIDAAAEARKDNIQSVYMNNKQNITNQKVASDQNKAANISAATSALGQAAASIVGSVPPVEAYDPTKVNGTAPSPTVAPTLGVKDGGQFFAMNPLNNPNNKHNGRA